MKKIPFSALSLLLAICMYGHVTVDENIKIHRAGLVLVCASLPSELRLDATKDVMFQVRRIDVRFDQPDPI